MANKAVGEFHQSMQANPTCWVVMCDFARTVYFCSFATATSKPLLLEDLLKSWAMLKSREDWPLRPNIFGIRNQRNTAARKLAEAYGSRTHRERR